MADAYLSLSNLAPAFEKQALVLVPNNRLRNHLLRAYALQQTAKAWIKPSIQSLSQWLESCWEQLQADGYAPACATVATPLQRQMLWEKAITQSPLGATLLQPQPLAQQADAALRNLELWALNETDVQPDNIFVDHKSNTAQFVGWLKTFKSDLARQGTITKEVSYQLVAQAFDDGSLPRLPEIYLEGFDDLPPLMQQVLKAATDHLIRLPNQIATEPQLIRTQANTTDEEMQAAALWSKARLSENPDGALIGIVVPNLGQCRDKIERIFTEVFEPTILFPTTARYTLPFNFSAGTPLGTTPLIHSLFEILNLYNSEWPLERLCNLLHSPFWGDAENELVVRTHLTTKLRQLSRLTVSTNDLRYYITQLEQQVSELVTLGLSTRLEHIANLFRRSSGNKTARNWLTFFDEVLAYMGWPGARRLDSQEYQQLNHWFEVRDQFASIDSHCAPVSYSQAYRYLRQLADKLPFQAQTPDSPIQILGALEAAGLQFSHIWIMGLSDNQWPSAPAPNPLLPLQLQRQHKMPHASAERELEIAKGLTERYRQSAPVVIFSNAHTDGDAELRTSALVRDIKLAPLDEIISTDRTELQNYYKAQLEHTELEVVHDEHGPQLKENERVRGGSNLFKLQALCPFTAFTELRLGAKKPDEPTIGFSPSERGNLLHESLAAIWKQLRDSKSLCAMNEIDLKTLVDEITSDTINHAQHKNQRGLGKIYCSLEQERLSNLLCEWLNGERNRPHFTVVAIEQENNIAFAGLTLKLRIDRIDQFANGDRLLIDYKTGKASAKDWQSDRPSEPQLPLYAVTADPDEGISATTFAVINRKQQTWEGIGELHDSSLNQPGIKLAENWAAQLDEWQILLQKLAEDFINGDARVDFKDQKSEDYAVDLLPLHRNIDSEAVNAYAASRLAEKHA